MFWGSLWPKLWRGNSELLKKRYCFSIQSNFNHHTFCDQRKIVMHLNSNMSSLISSNLNISNGSQKFQILRRILLFGALATPMISVAHPRNCLESSSIATGSDSFQTTCTVVQRPHLVKGLFTFPYLGTRSYEVQYWEGILLKQRSYVSRYLQVVVNRCSGETLSSQEYWVPQVFSERFELTNSNTSEFIRKKSELAPMTEAQMRKEWKKFSAGCI